MRSFVALLVALLATCSVQATSHRHRLSKLKTNQLFESHISAVPSWSPSAVWGDVTSSNLCYADGVVYIAVMPVLSANVSTVWRFNATTHQRLPGEIAFNSTDAIIQIFCSPSTRSIFTLIVDLNDPTETQYVQQRSVDSGKLISSFVLDENLQVIWGVDVTGTLILSGSLVASGGVSLIDAVTGQTKTVLDGGESNMQLGGAAFHQQNGCVVILDVTSRSLYGIDIKSNKITLNASLPDDISLYGSVIVDPRGYSAWVSYGTDNAFEMPFWNRFVQIELSTGKQLLKLEYDVPNSFYPAQFISSSDDSPSSFWWLDQGGSSPSRPARFVKQNGMNHTEYQVSSYSAIPEPSGVGVLSNGSVVVALSADFSIRILNQAGVYVSEQVIDRSSAAGNNKHVKVDSQDRIIVPVNASAIHIYNSDGSLSQTVLLDQSVNPWMAQSGPSNTIYFIDFNVPNQVTQVSITTGKIVSIISGSKTASFVDLAVNSDTSSSNIWIADLNGQILQYSSSGTLLTSWNLTDISAFSTVIRSLAWDITNNRIVVARSLVDNQGLSTSSILWIDIKSSSIVGKFMFPHAYEVSSVAVSHDGSAAYTTGISRDELIVWKDLPTLVTEHEHEQ